MSSILVVVVALRRRRRRLTVEVEELADEAEPTEEELPDHVPAQ